MYIAFGLSVTFCWFSDDLKYGLSLVWTKAMALCRRLEYIKIVEMLGHSGDEPANLGQPESGFVLPLERRRHCQHWQSSRKAFYSLDKLSIITSNNSLIFNMGSLYLLADWIPIIAGMVLLVEVRFSVTNPIPVAKLLKYGYWDSIIHGACVTWCADPCVS